MAELTPTTDLPNAPVVPMKLVDTFSWPDGVKLTPPAPVAEAEGPKQYWG